MRQVLRTWTVEPKCKNGTLPPALCASPPNGDSGVLRGATAARFRACAWGQTAWAEFWLYHLLTTDHGEVSSFLCLHFPIYKMGI